MIMIIVMVVNNDDDNKQNNNNHTRREAVVFPVQSVLSIASGCVDALLYSALMQKTEVAEALADPESCFVLNGRWQCDGICFAGLQHWSDPLQETLQGKVFCVNQHSVLTFIRRKPHNLAC